MQRNGILSWALGSATGNALAPLHLQVRVAHNMGLIPWSLHHTICIHAHTSRQTSRQARINQHAMRQSRTWKSSRQDLVCFAFQEGYERPPYMKVLCPPGQRLRDLA